MVTRKIILPTVSDVKEFVSIMNSCPVDADLTSGRYKVDAKSLMGIFSLDLNNELKLHFETDDEQEIEVTMLRIQKFILA